MAYATGQDIIDRIGEDDLTAIADRDGDADTESEAISTALDDATELIDSYLSVRYPLPLTETPGTVVRACVDIAVYNLSQNKTTDEVEKRYNHAISWLKDIATGKAGLGNTPAGTASSSGAAFSAGDRLFTRTTLNGGF